MSEFKTYRRKEGYELIPSTDIQEVMKLRSFPHETIKHSGMKDIKEREIKYLELRSVTDQDIEIFSIYGYIIVNSWLNNMNVTTIIVNIPKSYVNNGSPKKGDMIARNPENLNDQWLITKEHFEAGNFKPVEY